MSSAPVRSAFPIMAFLALVASATAMGISPVFVRLAKAAEIGPFTSAFYRVALALPLLYGWMWLERRRKPAPDPGWTWVTVLSGLFFAGDLFFWHLATLRTTLANATLLSSMAPVWVAAFSGAFIGEKVGARSVVGLAICVAGGIYLVGAGFQASPEHLLGDLFGVGTSFFFGLYFLVVRIARRDGGTALVLFRSSVVTTVVLGAIAAATENSWLPVSLTGVLALLAMAWISHSGGQGLLAYALGHLTAAFSSLVIFLEALAAAIFGWIFYSEALGMTQLLGGAAILAGIWIARPAEAPPVAPAPNSPAGP